MSEIIARRRFSLKQPTAFFVGTSAGIISLLALVGWGTGNVFLKSVQPDYAPMKPNAAVGILLLGVGLAFAAASEKMRIVPGVLSAAAALIGLLTIIEHLTGFDAGIDTVLFADSIAAAGSPSAGRMTFAAALSLLLLGVSLMAARAKGRGTIFFVQSLTLSALFIALVTIIEYIYNVRLFERVPILTTPTLNAAFAFLLLSVGILHLVGNRGLTRVFWSEHAGGLLARRLIPVIVIFPMLTGWVIFTLEQEGYFPATFALALFAGTTIISLSGLVWLTSLSIEKSEIERLEVKERLKDANRKLEAVNKELESFSYSVSHDLRAPLRAMDGFSQVLAEEYGGKLDSTGLDYLNRVCSASRKMARLIDDLLMLSRISRKELNRVTVNLSELANLILREWMEAEPDRSVDCSIQDGVFANCDENLARVALENLLSNSWKFTSKKECAEIAFGTENSGGFPEIYVRDNGAGFDMAFADKLFGAFQRLHSEAEFPGTGIGLVTVKRIITLHGGSIRSRASPGNGASFFFTFEQR